jgi:hypothetical protein
MEKQVNMIKMRVMNLSRKDYWQEIKKIGKILPKILVK